MPIVEIGLNDGLKLWDYLGKGNSADVSIVFGMAVKTLFFIIG